MVIFRRLNEIPPPRVSPLVLDHLLQHCHQLLAGHVVDAELLGHAAVDQALHIVALVPEEREHQHGHAVADALVDAVGAPVGDEDLRFGVG